MCRRHWFKSPARWLTLPNLVCPSGPAWCPIGLPVECNEITHTYKYMRKSRSNVFRVPFREPRFGKETKKKIRLLLRSTPSISFFRFTRKTTGSSIHFQGTSPRRECACKDVKMTIVPNKYIYIFGIIKKNISLNQSLSDSHNEQDPDNYLQFINKS